MKTTLPSINLTNEEALLLQQISESGEEDIVSLSANLQMNRRRVVQLLDDLKRQRLITVKAIYGDWWVHLSLRGKRLIQYMWPEMAAM